MSIGNISFSVQTMHTKNGGALRELTPDKEGIYRGIPLTVIGKASRNNVYYDVDSMVEAINNPKSRFNKGLEEGHIEGEWGHPLICSKDDMARLLHIDRKCVSHYFHHVYPKPTACGKYVVVYGDVVPWGPYGKYLKDAFHDPKRNAAFSLRSMTTAPQPRPDGTVFKRILALVTFDAVDTPGFEEACKRYVDPSVSSGVEHLNFADYAAELIPQEMQASLEDLAGNDKFLDAVGFESINDCQEVLDLLQADEVVIKNQIDLGGKFNPMHGQIVGNGSQVSAFHKLF